MDYAVLNELKNTISGYQPLIDYVNNEFGKDFSHFIGNKLRERARPDDYPFILYYSQWEDVKELSNVEYKLISQTAIQYAIKNEDVEQATRQILDIKELIVECLKQNHRLNGLVLDVQVKRFETDQGYFQPYFFARLLINMEEIK